MAHPNIDERRAAVKQALDLGPLTSQQKHDLAARFGCHISAIRADIQAIRRPAPPGKTYHVSVGMRRRIIERDEGICQYCNCKPERPIIEHVIPASQGGLATEENLVVACQSCNVKKRYQDEDRYQT